MPGNLTAGQEKLWNRAKEAAAKSKDKSVAALKDDDFALVQHIFQKMKKAHGESKMFNRARFEANLHRAVNLFEAVALKLRATGLKDIKGIEPGLKDVARMHDIVSKSHGDTRKMMQLVKNMASAITDRNKAQRRAAAALKILPQEIRDDAALEFLAKW